MFIKHAQIQLGILNFAMCSARHLLDALMVSVLLLNINYGYFNKIFQKNILLSIFTCLFMHYIGRRAILCKQNKTYTSDHLRRLVCVFFAIN